jgi:hypothetical protein
VRAAGLWASGRGALSGPAAAWWHGMLPAAPDRVELTVARRCGLRSRDGVRFRRRDLDRRDVVAVDGLVVMAKPLAALETAAVVADGSAFLDRALRRHVGFESVYQSYCRNLGAYGGAQVAEMLVATADRADSAAERVIVKLLRRAGITGWELGLPFGWWTIDLAFKDAKVSRVDVAPVHLARPGQPARYVVAEIRAALA